MGIRYFKNNDYEKAFELFSYSYSISPQWGGCELAKMYEEMVNCIAVVRLPNNRSHDIRKRSGKIFSPERTSRLLPVDIITQNKGEKQWRPNS